MLAGSFRPEGALDFSKADHRTSVFAGVMATSLEAGGVLWTYDRSHDAEGETFMVMVRKGVDPLTVAVRAGFEDGVSKCQFLLSCPAYDGGRLDFRTSFADPEYDVVQEYFREIVALATAMPGDVASAALIEELREGIAALAPRP